MEVICKPRGGGKTTDLIMESAKTRIPILTGLNSIDIVFQARKMGVSIPQPMTYKEYERYRRNDSLTNSKDWNGKLLIDEVDYVLSKMLDAKIEKVTCTPDSMNTIYDGCGTISQLNKVGNFTPVDSVCKKINEDMEKKIINEAYGTLMASTSRYVRKPVINKNDIDLVNFDDKKDTTVIKWKDGTISKVKVQLDKGDTYNPELGMAMCIAKKALGNKGNFNEVFKKWLPENED